MFEAEVNTFLDHFETALHFIINHPQSLIADVELINDQERLLLVPPEKIMELELDIHDQRSYYSNDRSIQTVGGLIELQAERTPQRIAVSGYI